MNEFREEVSCMRCKLECKCKLVELVREQTGLRSREMCFYCFVPKDLVIKDSFNNNQNCTIKIG
jgi:hypothetical protein